MKIPTTLIAIIALVVLLLTGCGMGQTLGQDNPTTAPVEVEQINLYLVALDDNGQSGPKIGCQDSLVAIEQEIAPSTTPLKSAYQELLAVKSEYYGQTGLYNALHRSDLEVQDAKIDEENRATIHLAGEYALGGVCDGPRFENQLKETALQFSTVSEVTIFINDTPLEDALSLRE